MRINSAKSSKITLYLPKAGDCCWKGIERVLDNMKISGVIAEAAKINKIDNQVELIYQAEGSTLDQLNAKVREELDNAGYENSIAKNHAKPWLKGLTALLAGVGWLVISIFSVILSPWVLYLLGGLSTLLTFYVGFSCYLKAYKQFRSNLQLGMESLFTFSTLTAVIISIASFFIPGLPMLFGAALMILGCRQLGDILKRSAKEEVLKGMSLQDVGPKLVKIIKKPAKGGVKDCLVGLLQRGDKIEVAAGQVIPVDGKAIKGKVWVLNTDTTGGILPVKVRELKAGMVAENSIKMEVGANVQSSALAQGHRDLEAIEADKKQNHAKIARVADKLVKYFVPAVILLAAVAGLLTGIFMLPAFAIKIALTILVSACPCVLGMVVPLSLSLGRSKAEKQGIVFKYDNSLEQLAQADTIVFDLNGTLTEGNYHFTHTLKEKWLKYAYLLEAEKLKQAPHGVAKAIYDELDKLISNKETAHIKEINLNDHAGISAKIGGQECCLGTISMVEKKGIAITAEHKEMVKQSPTKHHIFFACENEIKGYFVLEDRLRHNAKQVVQKLQKMGKTIHLCTGASQQTANKYARELGIPMENVKGDRVRSQSAAIKGQLTKPDYIKELQAKGHKVAMIGDAVNDVAALLRSDVGIALCKSNENNMVHHIAGVKIKEQTDKSLWQVVTAMAVAKQTVSSIKQGLFLSLIYNSSVMLITLGVMLLIGFALNPAIGAALMVLQSLLILGAAYRFKQAGLPAATEVEKEGRSPNNSCKSMLQTFMQCMTPSNHKAIKQPLEVNQSTDLMRLAPLTIPSKTQSPSPSASPSAMPNKLASPSGSK